MTFIQETIHKTEVWKWGNPTVHFSWWKYVFEVLWYLRLLKIFISPIKHMSVGFIWSGEKKKSRSTVSGVHWLLSSNRFMFSRNTSICPRWELIDKIELVSTLRMFSMQKSFAFLLSWAMSFEACWRLVLSSSPDSNTVVKGLRATNLSAETGAPVSF